MKITSVQKQTQRLYVEEFSTACKGGRGQVNKAYYTQRPGE